MKIPYACAECGTEEADTYVVTGQGKHDRTEVCRECDDELRKMAGDLPESQSLIGKPYEVDARFNEASRHVTHLAALERAGIARLRDLRGQIDAILMPHPLTTDPSQEEG